jgi:hypothetical protein
MSLACLARNKSECGEEDSPAKAQRRQGKSENFLGSIWSLNFAPWRLGGKKSEEQNCDENLLGDLSSMQRRVLLPLA